MPKRPPVHKDNGRGKKRKAPETATDWLQESLDLEDSGDRWIQDPPKAHRFYLQALVTYDRALALDGTLFDAAYNKARVLLQISQVCALLAAPRLDVIKQAIVAHRQLAAQYQTNTDVRYNLAMVLMSYAEVVSAHKVLEEFQSDGSIEKALSEAFDNLSQCLRYQNAEMAELESSMDTPEFNGADSQQVADLDSERVTSDVDVSYISNDSIFDTLISLLEYYNNLLELENLSDAALVSTAKEFIVSEVLSQVHGVIPKCHEKDVADRFAEVSHSIQLAELEYAYRRNTLSLEDWKSQLERVLAAEASVSVPILCSNADACKSLASYMSDANFDPMDTWKVLTNGASAQITRAIEQVQGSGRKAPNLFIAKADIELLRANVKCPAASRNVSTLHKNAVVYYKRAISDCLPKDIRLKNEAALKSAIVEGQLSDAVTPVPEMSRDEASQIVADAREDGLFEGSWKLLDAK